MLLALAVSAALAAAPISVRSLAAVVVARTPMWIRHYNASVAPARCGDINIEPLFPIGISDETIQRYASNSIEDYSGGKFRCIFAAKFTVYCSRIEHYY